VQEQPQIQPQRQQQQQAKAGEHRDIAVKCAQIPASTTVDLPEDLF